MEINAIKPLNTSTDVTISEINGLEFISLEWSTRYQIIDIYSLAEYQSTLPDWPLGAKNYCPGS